MARGRKPKSNVVSIHRGDGSVDPDRLRSLMNSQISQQGQLDEIRGDMGQEMKEAVETHGVNRKAFAWCKQLSRMDAGKRSAVLKAFESYVHVLALDAQTDLFDEPEEIGDEQLRKAYEAGKDAAFTGDRRRDNPHGSDDPRHESWAAGWDDFHRAAQERAANASDDSAVPDDDIDATGIAGVHEEPAETHFDPAA